MGNVVAGGCGQDKQANPADLQEAAQKAAELEAKLRAEVGAPPAPEGKMGGGAGYYGGAYVGGYHDLQSYGNSMYSKAKENLIRNIAKEVFSALHVKGVKDPMSAPISDVVASLTKLIPARTRNPKKFHDSFNKSEGSQKAVCRALASAINKHYSGALIDADGDLNEACDKIAEVMHSLLTGLHTEFMNVAGDVMRVMSNMQLAMNYLDAAYKRQRELVAATGDESLKDKSASTDAVHDAVKGEYERQMAILANLVNVAIGPTGKSLISSLEENRDFTSLVKDLRAMVGTQAFGDKLSYLLSGVSTVAHTAELVDKALHKIGMSAADFKSASGPSELRAKVFNHIMKASPNAKRLDEMMAAAKIIYEAKYDRDAVAKLLSKSGKGETSGAGDPDSDSDSEEHVDGGADIDFGDDDADPNNQGLTAYWQRKSLSSKIKKKRTYRDLVLKDFRKILRGHIQAVVEASNGIGRKIGNEIPLSDELRTFVDAFGNLPNIDRENMHIILSGFPKDALSREDREKFMYDYELVMKTCEPLIKGPAGSMFSQLRSAIASMIKTLDDFSDKIVKSLTEIHVDTPDEIASAFQKSASAFFGAGDAGEDSFGSGSWVAFSKVRDEMRYFYSIANVKTNLARSVDDLKSYADNYEQILGEEAAWLIDRIREAHLEKIEKIDLSKPVDLTLKPDTQRIWAQLKALRDAGAGAAKVNADGDPDAGLKTPAEWTLDNLKALWTYQMNAKVNMVKVAQAVDLYMQSFTDGIAQHPDSISSVIKMLDQVEIVAKWFNDRSGDNLASLFEVFPAGKDGVVNLWGNGDPNGGTAIINKAGVLNIPFGPDHYYMYLENPSGNARLPGNHLLGRQLSADVTSNRQLKGVLMLSEKVVKSMRALENILSAFASVGSRFGDVEPMAKSFMNPGQMFNALCSYVAASAFTHEFMPGCADISVGVYQGPTSQLGQIDGTLIPNNDPSKYRLQATRGIYSTEALAASVGKSVVDQTQPDCKPNDVNRGNLLNAERDNNVSLAVLDDLKRRLDDCEAGANVAATKAAAVLDAANKRAATDKSIQARQNAQVLSQATRKVAALTEEVKRLKAEEARLRTEVDVVSAMADSLNDEKKLLAGEKEAAARSHHLALSAAATQVKELNDKIASLNKEIDDNPEAAMAMGRVRRGAPAPAPAPAPARPDDAELEAKLEMKEDGVRGGGIYGGANNEYGILSGVANGNLQEAKNLKSTSLAMSSIPAEAILMPNGEFMDPWVYHDPSKEGDRVDVAGWRDNFFDTDHIFQMVIKSIIAKIFTVVDAYRLFHRPVMDRRAHYSLNPLRTILGGVEGGAAAMVKIVPEALELYYRLVLLAEWYRDKFSIKSNSPAVNQVGINNAWRLAMVPNIDGVWSDFIDVIFDKADYVAEGNYTETQVQKLLLAMNNIWKNYKARYPKSTVRQILNAFVLEMNRAFGFLKSQEINDYLKDRRSFLNQDMRSPGDEQFLNYDILDADDQFGARPAPSDRFAKVSAKTQTRKTRNPMFMQKVIEDLRKKIDLEFLQETSGPDAGIGSDSSAGNSFQETLKNYKIDLLNAKSDRDEYNVVLRMLQGANKQIHVSVDKLIMVHEAVAAPLMVLYATYKVLAKYNALMHGASLKNLAAWNATRAGGPAIGNKAAFDQAYRNFLATVYTKRPNQPGVPSGANDVFVKQFSTALLGNLNKRVNNSGYLRDVRVAAGAPVQPAQLDGPHLLQDIFAMLLDFGTNPNKLVTVNVGTNGNINVDFNAIEELATSLLRQVKDNIKKLRTAFAPDKLANVIDRYENRETIGSTRWLEENLIQVLLKDRDECGVPRAHDHMVHTLAALCATDAAGVNNDYGTMDNAVRGLLYYESGPVNLPDYVTHVKPSVFPGNIMGLRRLPETDDEKKAVSQANAGGNIASVPALNSIMTAPRILFTDNPTSYELDAYGNHKSLLLALNRILRMYIYTNMEEGQSKFYTPLIEQFATSTASIEVMQGKAFPDIAKRLNADPADESHRPFHNAMPDGAAAPPQNTVIFGSNALLMRALLTTIMSVNNAQKKRFAFESISEIPEYLKERMRVNLPFFAKMFGNLADRAILLKNIINNSDVKKNMLAVGPAGENITDRVEEFTADLFNPVGLNSVANLEYCNGLLTRIIDCSTVLRKSAESVYKELQDKPPVFFETTKDFLADYRSRNGGLPLMPASSMLMPMRCLEGSPQRWSSLDESHLMLPTRENGSNVYKFNFATRNILARNDLEVGLDHTPGAKEIYNSYAAAGQHNLISPSEYALTLKLMFKLGRFLMDGAVYGRLLDRPSRDLHNCMGDYAARNMFEAIKWRECFDGPNKNHLEDTAYATAVANPKITAYRAAITAKNQPNQTSSNKNLDNARNANPAALNGDQLANDAPMDLLMVNIPSSQGVRAPNDAQKLAMLRVLPLADSNNLGGLLELTENAVVGTSKERLANYVDDKSSGKNSGNRVKLRVYNILDMGIVPLNVHAFMREVPFVNILNYSYTFDRMVHDFVIPSYINNGLSQGPWPAAGLPDARYPAGDGGRPRPPQRALSTSNLIMGHNDACMSTREMMVKLLVHPYAQMGEASNEYFSLVASLFNGNDDLRLGRPRYLSDQLWHKVLLTSSAQLPELQVNGRWTRPTQHMLEAGPSAFEVARQSVRFGFPDMGAVNVNYDHGMKGNQYPVATPGLKRFNNKNQRWEAGDMHPVNVVYCAEVGKARFDSKLVRNLVWFVQLQRILRVVLIEHLSWLNTPVVRGLKIADRNVTEYHANDQFTEKDYDGSRYEPL